MATSIIDTVSSNLEKVHSKVEEWFESTDSIYRLIGTKGPIEKVSRYMFRVPFMQYIGGQFRKYSANGGPLGSGTGMKLSHFTGAYFYSTYNCRVTQEQMDISGPDQSVINVFSTQLSRAILEAQVYADITLHQNGTGFLTNGASAIAAGPPATMTFAAATDYLDVSMLREGMCVDVWNNAGSTKRAPATAAPLIIVSINYNSGLITFDQGITGLSAAGGGDRVAFRDMDIYGPASLTSFSSTWPDRTVAGGIGGDSFRHGFPYVNDVTTSNYYGGVLKSTVPQIMPTRVNASSAAITFSMGLDMLDGIRKRRDPELVRGLIGITSMKQRKAIQNLGVTIANKYISGDQFGKSVDLQPSNHQYGDITEFCGIPLHTSKRQDASRLDFVNPATWMRAQVKDASFYDTGKGTVHEVRDGDGGIVAAVEFYMTQAFDWVCLDPGAGGYIDALAIPA